MKNLLLCLSGIIIFLALPNPVLAKYSSFELDQTNFFLQISGNKEVRESIIVRNLTDQPISVSLAWEKVNLDPNRVIDFAKLQNTSLEIQPFAIASTEIVFNSPDTLKPGDYYGSLKIYSSTRTETANFTLRLLGKLDESVGVSQVTLKGSDLSVNFRNTGNITSTVKGKLIITNFFGQKTMNKNIDQFDLKASDTSTKKFVLNTIIPGPYQVQVETSFGTKATTQTRVYTVWYFDLRTVFISIFLVVSLAVGFFLLRRPHA